MKTPSSFARWQVVVLLMGFAALGHFNRVGISVVGSEVFIPQLGISETRMGWVYSAFLIAYTLGMLPAGWLIDRIGSVQALSLYGVTMGGFVVLTGGLGGVTSSPTGLFVALLVIRSLAGICNTPLHPGAAHVVSELFSGSGRSTANGLITAGALIGIAFCYPVVGWLMDRLSWPLAFFVSGVCLMAYALLWKAFTSSTLAVGETARPEPADVAAVSIHSPSSWALLRERDLWLLALSYAAYGYFQYLFFYWMDYYFKTILHVPAVEARWASFWIMLAQGLGMAVGGVSTDGICRWLGTLRGRRFIVMTAMGSGALFDLLGVNVTGQINVAMCLALSMGALGVCEGVFWTKATELGGSSRGFSAAFMNTGGNLGGLISPALTPAMAERMGWPGAITVACIVAGLGGGVWFLMKAPQRAECV